MGKVKEEGSSKRQKAALYPSQKLYLQPDMKKTLSHLPKSKQTELKAVADLIRKHAKPEMIILFGSYARGDYKEAKDLPKKRKSGHVSDYDILVITKDEKSAQKLEGWSEIGKQGGKLNLSTYFRIIAHDIKEINNKLEKGHYFFSDIVKEGVLIYDSKKFVLADRVRLTPEEQKEIAKEHFDHWFGRAQSFFKHYGYAMKDKDYKSAAFNLHQTAEASYKAILLVFENYNPNEHFLKTLSKMAAKYDPALRSTFPKKTYAEDKLFKKLDYAYIGGRYDPKYTITKEELDYLAKCVKKLLDRTKVICTQRLKAF
jgi:HEPN domain-containing protein/predicted nucleotidyltransferase